MHEKRKTNEIVDSVHYYHLKCQLNQKHFDIAYNIFEVTHSDSDSKVNY